MIDTERLQKALIRRAPLRAWRQRRFLESRVDAPAVRDGARPLDVLVLGVYLADRPNHAARLHALLADSGASIRVEQRWTALGGISGDPALQASTRTVPAGTARRAKFALINAMLRPGDADRHDHVLVCDDDILVPQGFLPAFLAHQRALDFAVAQPARALHSHFDHLIVMRRPWLRARQTRFVECGPLVSFRRDAARLLVPFAGEDEMWGQDLVWPVELERAGLKMGIVDATPVDHSLRPQASSYDPHSVAGGMHGFLERTPHLPLAEAATVVARHWRTF